MNIGEYYQLIRQCGCGSGLVSSWYKSEDGVDVKLCDRCSPSVLCKIFEKKYAELFEGWLGSLFSAPVVDHEWQWEDLLREVGCEQVVGLKAAKRRRGDRVLIPCPSREVMGSDSVDRTVHILVPREFAESVLREGKI